MAGAVAGSAVLGYMGSQSAADTQADASREGIAAQERMFNRQIELQEPFRQAGVNALAKLEGASEYTPFGMSQFQADPGYAFRLSEGQRALENSAAARGGLLSGNTGKALTAYGQNMGSQEYQNAFNRYQAERSATLNPLQSLAGMGQTSTNALTGAAGAYGANTASLYGDIGAAQSAGTVGGVNALTGGLSSYLKYSQGNDLIKALRDQRGYTDGSEYGSFG